MMSIEGENPFSVGEIDDENLGIFAEEGVSFEPVEPPEIEEIDFGSVEASDLAPLAEERLDFEPLDNEDINDINFNNVPAEDLSILANQDLALEQLNTEDVEQIDFSDINAGDISILAEGGLDLTELDSEDINQIDFNSIPAQNLSLLAEGGLNFEAVGSEDVSQIDFNSIPAEDISVLKDSGLSLESASNEAIADVRLGVAAEFGYNLNDAFGTDSLSPDTTFGDLSNRVLGNANLFNYKGENLNLDDGFSISEVGQLDGNDYKALDFAFEGNSIFDSSFYLEKNPQVAESGINPFSHYFYSGADEGRDPTTYFDTSYYFENNFDVANDENNINPLFHYFNTGASENRDPDPAFDTSFYLEEYPKVAESGINPLLHYFQSGADEGRYANENFKTLEETGEAFAVSTDISDRDFEVLKEEVFSVIPAEEQETAGLFPLILVPAGAAVIGIGVLSYEIWKANNNLQEALNGSDIDILWIPVDEQLTDGENITTFDPPNVDFGTPPFDLGEPIGFDDNTFFPKGDGFLDDVLNGRFEFPDEGEGGFTFFNAIESFSEGIDEPSRNLIGLSDVDEVLDSASRPSKKGSETSRGLQALQKRIDLGDSAYAGFSKTEEDVDQIIEETLGASNTNPIIKTGINRNQQSRIDVFNSTTGRGVRFVNGKFDTFVNF